MTRLIAVVLVLVATSAHADEIDRRSKPAFTDAVAERIHAKLPRFDVKVTEPLTLAVTSEGRSLQVNLDRIWEFCKDAAHDCLGEVDHMIDAVGATPRADQPAPVSAEQLRTMVRGKDKVDAYGERMAAGQMLAEPLAGDLWIVIGVDTPRMTGWATKDQLAPLGKSRAELFALAEKNVRAELGPLDQAIQPGAIGPGKLGYTLTRNAYEASRLLQHDEWKRYADQGKLLVSAPANDVVLFCVDCPVVVLQQVTAKMKKESATPLSDTVLLWTPNGWKAQ